MRKKESSCFFLAGELPIPFTMTGFNPAAPDGEIDGEPNAIFDMVVEDFRGDLAAWVFLAGEL